MYDVKTKKFNYYVHSEVAFRYIKMQRNKFYLQIVHFHKTKARKRKKSQLITKLNLKKGIDPHYTGKAFTKT